MSKNTPNNYLFLIKIKHTKLLLSKLLWLDCSLEGSTENQWTGADAYKRRQKTGSAISCTLTRSACRSHNNHNSSQFHHHHTEVNPKTQLTVEHGVLDIRPNSRERERGRQRSKPIKQQYRRRRLEIPSRKSKKKRRPTVIQELDINSTRFPRS